MSYFNIPTELIEMLRERKVIPFIGAGFSAVLKLPNWEELLKNIASDIQEECGLTYEEVKEYCQGNHLEMAEYYFIKSNKNIGPLRYSISHALKSDISPLESGAHVELINLGSQQIYTTNYDDLIEKTYKALGLKADVVALANDVANINNREYQVVKFHGDLKYEDTLVLTESSYFSRLNFDTPMDIKFRGDLLGKAVLFMGYSFRDINIRIIWFKLMEMMKGISNNNKPISYIVRFTHNPVLEDLYESVGIKTILLDPQKKFTSHDEMNRLFSEFMYELAHKASSNGLIPFSNKKLYFSKALYERTMGLLEQHFSTESTNSRELLQLTDSLNLISQREVHENLYKYLEKILLYISGENFNRPFFSSDLMINVSKIALKIVEERGFSDYVFLTLLSGITFNKEVRNIVWSSNLNWELFWKQKLIPAHAELFLEELNKLYIQYHEKFLFNPGEEAAYLIDIALRLKEGNLIHNTSSNIRKMADDLIIKFSDIYESVADYIPNDDCPDLTNILEEINNKKGKIEFSSIF